MSREDFEAVRAAINIGRRDVAIYLLSNLQQTCAKEGEFWYLLSQVIDDPKKQRDFMKHANELGYIENHSISIINNLDNQSKKARIINIYKVALVKGKNFFNTVILVIFCMILATPCIAIYGAMRISRIKVYSATPKTEQGRAFALAENTNYYYICNRVHGILSFDFTRNGCVFAVHLEEKDDSFTYKSINPEYINIFGLEPEFTWGEEYTPKLLFALFLLVFGGMITFIIIDNIPYKTKKKCI